MHKRYTLPGIKPGTFLLSGDSLLCEPMHSQNLHLQHTKLNITKQHICQGAEEEEISFQFSNRSTCKLFFGNLINDVKRCFFTFYFLTKLVFAGWCKHMHTKTY